MKPVRIHHPGVPVTPEPPDSLVALTDTVSSDPLVSQCGITTTTDGHWALYVTVPSDATVPIASVEHGAGGFPVVYEAASREPVRAGPAYPRRKP